MPSNKLAQNAIAVSGSLKSLDPIFTLEIGRYYPHLSLYMFELKVESIPKIEEILQKLAQNTNKVNVSATKFYLDEVANLGYIDAEYDVTNDMKNLQDQVVASVNPLRAGLRERDKAKIADAEGLVLKNLQDYGYVAVGKLFRPHVTLTRFKKHTPEVLDMLPSINTFEGSFLKIGLFEMGNNGTCIRQIATYDLQ